MRLRTKALLLALGLAAVVFAWRSRCAFGESDAYPDGFGQGALLVVGDLQRTSLVERWMGRERNDAERARLLRALASEEDAAGLLLLGDLVFDGSDCGDWADLDGMLRPMAEQGLGMVLTPGNHDYWGPDPLACAQVDQRFFAEASQRYGVHRWGPVAIVALDSNRDVVEDGFWDGAASVGGAAAEVFEEGVAQPDRPRAEEQAAVEAAEAEAAVDGWTRQLQWLEHTLGQLEADASVRLVVLAAHHPPYSNSELTGDQEVSMPFVDLMAQHSKAKLFLAGHSHTYEHFVEDGRHFVVSGGGGGPRVTLLAGEEQNHADLFEGPSPRPFHYLRLSAGRRALRIEAHGFRTGETAVGVFDEFSIGY